MMQILAFLKHGAIGLCGILMYLAYRLLSREQGSPRPRKENLRYDERYFTGKWSLVDSHDIDFENFKAR